MPQYVHTGDGGRQVAEWRQSFLGSARLEETDIACPGSGAFSSHGETRHAGACHDHFFKTRG
jgi:hypothetical protein